MPSLSSVVRRSAIVFGLAIAGVILFVAGAVLPVLWLSFPPVVRQHPASWAILGLGIGLQLARRWSRDSAFVAIAERISGAMIGGGSAVLVGGVLLLCFATWAPHYLTWPWHRDADTFAEIARSWDDGVLPYRDVRAYNFPGHIYLHWLIGRVAGWGFTPALYGADLALLLAFLLTSAAWSRGRFGSASPGLISAAAFLAAFMELRYDFAAERDEQTPILAAMALLTLDGRPGRGGRIVSAILVAMALTIRPHAALFLPAFLVSVASGAREKGESIRRGLLEWSAALACFTAVGFAPLFLAGIADDFLDGLRIAAYGGPYGRANRGDFPATLVKEWRDGRVLVPLAANLALSIFEKGRLRDSARLWLVALVGATFYRPLHPVRHPYLILPVVLFSSMAAAPPIAWIVGRSRASDTTKTLAVLAILIELIPKAPGLCLPRECLPALSALSRGAEPGREPPGSRPAFSEELPAPYPWPDYVATLRHLREKTTSTTAVANVLKHPPFPAINGPSGRRSPFRAESGICWMWLVDVDLDAEFASQLETAGDSVVVWAPSEVGTQPRLRLPRLGEVILRHYRFEARFGRIEVWRRMRVPPGSARTTSLGR